MQSRVVSMPSTGVVVGAESSSPRYAAQFPQREVRAARPKPILPEKGGSVITRPGSDRRAFGLLLKEWRRVRRMSQLAVAVEASISPRHLSFVESGRSIPSRDMVLTLTETLDVPLRERNALLVAAGYAPLYPERALAS